MQSPPSLLSSPTLHPLCLPANHLHFQTLFPKRRRSYSVIHSWTKVPTNCSHFARQSVSPLHIKALAVEAAVETIPNEESNFIEIGYISKVHGLQGEVRIKPSTDFPELRFSEPGKRWLRMRISGEETIEEVELTEGRGQPDQKSWILSFKGIDTADKAKQIIGSTLLVKESDRPVLEEGEFYTHDLVGMTVVLKETGKPVGTVVNVFNFGSSDHLQVMLNSAEEKSERSASVKSETAASCPLVWVPFVEAIVPDVDMDKRVMQITPPKGLLELNIRSDGRSKKERRLLEWKERKKFQKFLLAAKKKLSEMGQQHLLQGFSFGEKAQKSLLANQIVGINFKLLHRAMQNIEVPSQRFNLSHFIAPESDLSKNALKISKKFVSHYGSEEKRATSHELYERGLHLISEGKIAIVLVMNEKDQGSEQQPDCVSVESVDNPPNSQVQTLFLDDKKFEEIEEFCPSVPLIVVSPAHQIQSSEELFSDHDYFGFDKEKVWFLEEEKLPVFSSSQTEQNRYQMLLKSPWEILQSPVGSGGVISLLSSHNIVGNLNKMGIEYVEVCHLGQRSAVGHPLPFGYVNSREADVGIKMLDDEEKDGDFDLIFSMRFLNRITEQIDKLQFYTDLRLNSHVKNVNKEWVDIDAISPNSYELRCSIYSTLNSCSSDKMCLMQIAD